jgi:hypothetical protein
MRTAGGMCGETSTADDSVPQREECVRGDAGNARAGKVSVILRWALTVAGCVCVAVWLLLALVHIEDRYRVGHVQGHWMALAQYAAHGTLYPPLSDGERFGGTRHMPLPIMVNAAASRLTGEYLRSGKRVAFVLFAILLGLLITTLRQIRCPWPLAIALTGLLPATNTGRLAGCAPGGDVLPVVLQIAALLTTQAALRHGRITWMIPAAGLAALGAASKLTGVWAALAVISWLAVRRQWRPLIWFAAVFAGTVTVTLGMTDWISQGRFALTLRTLAFAGTPSPLGWIRAPNQLIFFGSEAAIAVWMMVPFAALGALAAWRSSAITVYHHALGWSLLLTLFVFADVGAGLNQLLDPAVLTILSVGLFASGLPPDRSGHVTLATSLGLALVWAGVTGVRGAVPDLREAISAVSTRSTLPKYTPRPLASVLRPGERLLAEDPGIPVLLEQTPIVLDAFMLRRLDQVEPSVVDPLLRRIEHGEFAHVVLINPVDQEDVWWEYYHFGLRIRSAIVGAYALVGNVDGYYLYQPRPGGSAPR